MPNSFLPIKCKNNDPVVKVSLRHRLYKLWKKDGDRLQTAAPIKGMMGEKSDARRLR